MVKIPPRRWEKKRAGNFPSKLIKNKRETNTNTPASKMNKEMSLQFLKTIR